MKETYSAKETGRAAARRTAPKLPRVIRVGPNEWGKFGVLESGVYQIFRSNFGVYLILAQFSGFISDDLR